MVYKLFLKINIFFDLSIPKWATKCSSCEITTGSLFWTIIYCKSYYFTWTVRLSYLNATVPYFHFTTNTCACDWWCPCYWLRRKWFEMKQKPNNFIDVHVHTLYYSVPCARVFSMIYTFWNKDNIFVLQKVKKIIGKIPTACLAL